MCWSWHCGADALRPLRRPPLRVVEHHEVFARLLGIADDDAFARQRPVVDNSHISDCFTTAGIKHVVIDDAFAIQLHVAIWMLLKKAAKVLGQFRYFHLEMDCRE